MIFFFPFCGLCSCFVPEFQVLRLSMSKTIVTVQDSTVMINLITGLLARTNTAHFKTFDEVVLQKTTLLHGN